MARCEVCDLELDEVERFCPGCGVPAPRRVVEVSTSLRESFHGAAPDDDDTEYAFGSKRVVKTAPPPPPSERKRPAKARKAAPAPPEPVAEPEPVREPEPEPVREPEPEPVREPEPDPEPVLREPEMAPEPEPVVLEIEDEPAVPQVEVAPDLEVSEEELAPQDEAPETDDGALGVDVVPGAEDEIDDGEPEIADEDAGHPVPLPPPAPVVVKPVVAEDAPVTPYVVLPVRRAVAVREVEPVVEEVAAESEPPRGGRWKVAFLVVVIAIGCVAAYVLTGRSSVPIGAPFTAEAQDRAISLDAPAGWRVESRGPGVLGIGEAARDIHVHATAIRRSVLADDLSLKRRADDVQTEFLASLTDVDASRPLSTKVGPHPAIRQVLTTSSVIYIHTVVKMPKYFVNVLAWTSAERFNDAQEKLLDVVGTLQSSG